MQRLFARSRFQSARPNTPCAPPRPAIRQYGGVDAGRGRLWRDRLEAALRSTAGTQKAKEDKEYAEKAWEPHDVLGLYRRQGVPPT